MLILTTFDLDEYVFAGLRAGASGYLLKDTPPADLLAAIRVIAAGDALLDPGVTRRLIAEFTRRPAPDSVPGRPVAALAEITEREREVLMLVGLGLSNTEIASRLHEDPADLDLTHAGRSQIRTEPNLGAHIGHVTDAPGRPRIAGRTPARPGTRSAT